jgi:2,4-dienoyl-CoA reductase-like NADH-dependent reductase (Old Yellow Enzyme family)/thioredoxin reductase
MSLYIDHVMKPLQVKGVTFPNRVARPAHGTSIGQGVLSRALMEYHLARARGGVGLTVLETLGMHYTCPSGGGRGLNITPDLVRSYREFMDMVRPTGMVVFQQIWHGGFTRFPTDGSPPWSASDVACPKPNTVMPIPMNKAMIAEIVEAFASSAKLCEEGGLHGVEVHGAHTYLIQQFMSPLTNFRTDEYGGSFENRMRFCLEVMRAIRARVSPDFLVSIRLSPEEVKGGMTAEDCAEVLKRLQAENLVDMVSVSLGGYYNEPRIIATMSEPAGYELPAANVVKAVATVPVIVTGRFRTLEEANQVVAHGEGDIVGMVRAHIADPNVVAKTVAGKAEEVRPCLGCNHGCIGAPSDGLAPHLSCTVNPVVGKELEWAEELIKPAEAAKKVLVIGGGPAGMEAARLARLRGHQVTLAEATDHLGGVIDIARRAPKRHGIADITDWLEREIYRLGVEVRLSTYIEASDVQEINPDVVIVATGSTPKMDGYQNFAPGEPIQGVSQPHVLSSWDLLSSSGRDFGKSALVFDEVGHYEAIAACEYLESKGLHVTYVTGNHSFGHRVESSWTSTPALERLTRDNRFTYLIRHKVLSVAKGTARVCPLYNEHAVDIAADTVVLVTHNHPNRELADELAEAGFGGQVKVVGEANSPRQLMIAIREGHMAGRTI